MRQSVRVFSAVSAAAVYLLVCPHALAGASFQGLGDLPGGGWGSTVTAISADGSTVIGQSIYDTISIRGRADWAIQDLWQPFRWTHQGGMAGLGVPGAQQQRFVGGISGDGSIIVGYDEQTTGAGKGFLWTAASGFSTFGYTSPTESFLPTGMSDDGSRVLGHYWQNPLVISDYGQSAVWTADGVEIQTTGFDLAGISPDGGVLAGAAVQPLIGRSEAVRWVIGQGFQTLPHLPGCIRGWATDLTPAGGMLVGEDAPGPFYLSEAFRWTPAEGTVGLGDLPGGLVSSSASAVSDDGQVIVGYGCTGTVYPDPFGDPMPFYEAFIWTPAEGMRNLREVLGGQYGLDLTGWTLRSAVDISADGTTIVGMGVNPEGNEEAWIVTIPEPTVLGMLLLAGLLWHPRRTRPRPEKTLA